MFEGSFTLVSFSILNISDIFAIIIDFKNKHYIYWLGSGNVMPTGCWGGGAFRTRCLPSKQS